MNKMSDKTAAAYSLLAAYDERKRAQISVDAAVDLLRTAFDLPEKSNVTVREEPWREVDGVIHVRHEEPGEWSGAWIPTGETTHARDEAYMVTRSTAMNIGYVRHAVTLYMIRPLASEAR